ncbi:hypothetical protein O181_049850 [Austropuccinia psidii MF-1]|uniref:Uncharacterized protein n=1 Tax=Austropuccinia psidii MF-1 TaxID=1389203 RepID=A0A9Q3DUB5_9BASI|nr:hypothetical protein [Austropuccinia psidii MF-1]
MSQQSPYRLIKLPKCMESLYDEEKHCMVRTILPVVSDLSSLISDPMHPKTLQNSSLQNTNRKDESAFNSEDHSMGRTISPAENDYPLSKNYASSNKKSNHLHRRYQIAEKLLAQILSHCQEAEVNSVQFQLSPSQME